MGQAVNKPGDGFVVTGRFVGGGTEKIACPDLANAQAHYNTLATRPAKLLSRQIARGDGLVVSQDLSDPPARPAKAAKAGA